MKLVANFETPAPSKIPKKKAISIQDEEEDPIKVNLTETMTNSTKQIYLLCSESSAKIR